MEADKLKNALKFLIPEVTRLFEAVERFTQFSKQNLPSPQRHSRRLGEIDCLVLRHFAVEEG